MEQDPSLRYQTVAGAIDGLTQRGFTELFKAVNGGLRAVIAGRTLGAGDLVIREFHRFEGISDPDDMAIVYALESRDGIRGTLTDAFGVYADPAISAAMSRIPFRSATGKSFL